MSTTTTDPVTLAAAAVDATEARLAELRNNLAAGATRIDALAVEIAAAVAAGASVTKARAERDKLRSESEEIAGAIEHLEAELLKQSATLAEERQNARRAELAEKAKVLAGQTAKLRTDFRSAHEALSDASRAISAHNRAVETIASEIGGAAFPHDAFLPIEALEQAAYLRTCSPPPTAWAPHTHSFFVPHVEVRIPVA